MSCHRQNHHLNEIVERSEVVAVACVERKAGGEGGCRDEEVDGSSSTYFPPGRHDGGEDAAVRTTSIGVEGERIERGLGPLEPVLAAPTLVSSPSPKTRPPERSRLEVGDAVSMPSEPAVACPICSDIAAAETGQDHWAVARLDTGYVRLNPNQYYRGAAFFVSVHCVPELHSLGRAERDRHLAEMAEVAHAVFVSVSPRKLNYEALGNSVAHLHWWLTPRHHDDAQPRAPIWEDPEFSRPPWSRWHPAPAERDRLRGQLLLALRDRDVKIHQTYV